MIYSPLRYPGGKGKLTPLVRQIIEQLEIVGGIYIEPFAGGAGIAMELLESGIVNDVVINDYDKGIASFWKSILYETDRFISCVQDVPLTMDEWYRQREILFSERKYSFELGFATFYMNRTNRSGIIKGGPIGGYTQDGEWTISSRFNREELINRIVRISRFKSSIHVYNKEIRSFITSIASKYENNALIYFDPPYFCKGRQLYMNYFEYTDHKRIEELIRKHIRCNWIITYDDCPEVLEIYRAYDKRRFDLSYTAAHRREASEVMIFKSRDSVPKKNSIICGGKDINLRRIGVV